MSGSKGRLLQFQKHVPKLQSEASIIVFQTHGLMDLVWVSKLRSLCFKLTSQRFSFRFRDFEFCVLNSRFKRSGLSFEASIFVFQTYAL